MAEVDLSNVKWDETPQVDLSKVKWDEKPDVSLLGVGAEVGKGLVRGPMDLGRTFRDISMGPAGALIGRALDPIEAPVRDFLKAAPANPTEQFAGTAAEIAGAGMVGGGAGSVRGAVMTGAGALGGAAGEQMGGEVGKIIGIVAGVAGVPVAQKVLKALGGAVGDVSATVGAGFGHQPSIEKLARESVTRTAGESAPKVAAALGNAAAVGPMKTELVPGVKPTVGEVITQAQSGQPEQFGGALIRLQKDLYGARGIEDILPTVAKQQKANLATHVANIKNQTAPMREAALDAANKAGINGMGVDPKNIIVNIEKSLSTPGIRASDVANKTLNEVKDKIQSLKSWNGSVDAKDLYTVRKEVGNTIQKFAKETANWDKQMSAGLQRDIQKFIDDAIEGAGGVGWKDYLKTYSAGMKGVEAQEGRLKEMKLIASGVKGQPSTNLVAGELPQAPTLLSRPMMLVNYALKAFAKDANAPVAREIALKMQHPGEFAKLVALPPADPKRKIAEEIAQRVLAASTPGITEEQQK